MYQIRNKTAPFTFSGNFGKIFHEYPTHFSLFNYKIPKTTLSKGKFRISFRRGPSIRNNFFQNSEKEIESLPLFKSKLKLKLLYFSNEIILVLSWQTSCWLSALAFYESFLVSKTNINLIIYN